MTQPTQPTTGVPVPAGTNIDPNASNPMAGRPLNDYGTAGEPSVNPRLAADPNAPPVAAPAANTAVSIPVQGAPSLAQSILGDSDNQVNEANKEIAQVWDQIRPLQTTVDNLRQSGADPQGLSSATTQLNTLYQTLSAAEQRLEQANVAKSQATQKVLDSVQLTPEQAGYYHAQAAKADADAESARAQAKVLTDGSEGQRALVAAQAGLAGAQAAAQKATADAQTAKTPAEIQQLQAQAAALSAQAAQTQALLPGLVAKQQAETGLTEAQTGLADANSDLVRANTRQADANTQLIGAQQGLTTAQAGLLTPAEAANQQSQAALNQAKIQQAQLGPVYGLQDQINAIKAIQDQVFGSAPPGADLDQLHQRANDLLQQYVGSQLGGTTPYAASVAAANAGQNIFQTQAALSNQASQAAASRANAFLGAGGNVLATLAGMNANAPAGSTAGAEAFQQVMNQMAQQSGQGQFAVPTQPQAPPLPSFLQQFAAPSTGAAAAGGGTTAPVTINIGGGSNQPQSVPLNRPTPVANVAPTAGAPMMSAPNPINGTPLNFGNTLAQGGAAPTSGLPNYLQGMAAPTMDFVHQLWGKELGSGVVSY